ncbi:hypothetical protein [Pararhodonellum marinum]|uniref:hypothetical protein n=1 Tax=Pararhodonellum marinum TaxID=2755358 RepID=UPI00189066FA|nr:hypothetical protein [Pararhodonellum marinum]
MILFALFFSIYTSSMIFKGASVSLKEAVANMATINALGIARLVGSVFILPCLVYLIYSFQRRPIYVMRGKE